MAVYQKWSLFSVSDWRKKGGRESHYKKGISQNHCSITSGKQSMAEGLLQNKMYWHTAALKHVLYTEGTFTFTKQRLGAGDVKLISNNIYL